MGHTKMIKHYWTLKTIKGTHEWTMKLTNFSTISKQSTPLEINQMWPTFDIVQKTRMGQINTSTTLKQTLLHRCDIHLSTVLMKWKMVKIIMNDTRFNDFNHRAMNARDILHHETQVSCIIINLKRLSKCACWDFQLNHYKSMCGVAKDHTSIKLEKQMGESQLSNTTMLS